MTIPSLDWSISPTTTLASTVGAFVAVILYGSFFEWTLHRYVMHRKTWPIFPYELHALLHHKLFRADESFHALSEEMKMHVTFVPRDYVLIVLVHTPIFFGIEMLTGLPVLVGAWVGSLSYLATFDILHYAFHVPGGAFIERFRWFRWLKRHHLLHHKYQDRNLNVVLPFADFVLGTRVSAPLYGQKVLELEK